MKKNSRTSVLVWLSALCMALAGCSSKAEQTDKDTGNAKELHEYTEKSSAAAEANSRKAQAAAESMNDQELENRNADCKITLNKDSAQCSGTGAEFTDGVLRITQAGCYEITGELEDGRIEIHASKEDSVELILNGVDVTCSDYAPFTVWQADRTLIYLSEGTVNQFTDGGNYYVSSASETDTEENEAPSAAFFSKDDLGFCGSGMLLVTANCNDGITGKDDVWFTGGTYQITAKDDGIVGKDSVAVQNAQFTIEAEGDGIKSTKEDDEEKGFVALKAGKFSIKAGNDGIQAATYLWAEGGTFDITAGGGSKEASNAASMMNQRGNATSVQAEEEESCKGLKAGVDITVLDGQFELDCADDTIHSNDTLTIKGGTFTMKSGDDGIHGDSVAVIAGGTVVIEESYEGIEAESVIIRDGRIDVTASDDGLNAANGSSAEGMDGPGGWPGMEGRGRMELPEGQMPSAATSDEEESQRNDKNRTQENPNGQTEETASSCILAIEGGELYVNAGGDGLDSNGSIIMNGGTVYVDGPVNDGNGILDYDKEMVMNGGTLVGAGGSGMLQSISESSSQPGLAVVFDASQKAGTNVTLKDSDGREVLSYKPAKAFTAVIVSDNKLELGETYEIYLGDEKYTSIELSSTSTSNGRSGMGNVQKGGQGGMKNRQEMDGGMVPPRENDQDIIQRDDKNGSKEDNSI